MPHFPVKTGAFDSANSRSKTPKNRVSAKVTGVTDIRFKSRI